MMMSLTILNLCNCIIFCRLNSYCIKICISYVWYWVQNKKKKKLSFCNIVVRPIFFHWFQPHLITFKVKQFFYMLPLYSKSFHNKNIIPFKRTAVNIMIFQLILNTAMLLLRIILLFINFGWLNPWIFKNATQQHIHSTD